MQCFIPFSEEVVEQHPELMAGGLVPFREEYLHYTMEFEILSPEQEQTLSIASFRKEGKGNQKVNAL